MKKIKIFTMFLLSLVLCFGSVISASAATNLFAGWPVQNQSTYQRSYSRAVQVMMLNYNNSTRGYIVNSGGANGYFGPGTASAVSAFQAAVGLSTDGSCGPDTWNALSNRAVTLDYQDATYIYYKSKRNYNYSTNGYNMRRNYKTNGWQCYYYDWYTVR